MESGESEERVWSSKRRSVEGSGWRRRSMFFIFLWGWYSFSIGWIIGVRVPCRVFVGSNSVTYCLVLLSSDWPTGFFAFELEFDGIEKESFMLFVLCPRQSVLRFAAAHDHDNTRKEGGFD